MILRRLRLAAGVAGLAAAMAGCSKSVKIAKGTDPSPSKIRFQSDWYPQPEQGGIYQALSKGFYREAGLDVDILAGGPGRPILTGLLAGQSDLELAQSDDVIVRIGAGLPLVIVGAVMEHGPLAVMVHADSPVRHFADLDGGTVMALPGTTWISFVKSRYHIEFKLIPMNYSLAEFMADRNLIQQCFITSEPFFAAQNGQKVRTLLIADSGYDPYRVYVTTRKFLREHPDQVRAFVAASIRGWNDFVMDDSGPARRLIQSLNPQMTPEFMDYSIKAIVTHRLVPGDAERGERTGLITSRRLAAQIDLLAKMKIVPATLRVNDVASFDALPPELRALAQ
jgi:NitT/TauT family transport system substrate-binding protein